MSGNNGPKKVIAEVTNNPGSSINEIATLTGLDVHDIVFIINAWKTQSIVSTDTNPVEHYTRVWRIPVLKK